MYVDLGISGDSTILDSLHVKRLVYGGSAWLIIDPGLESYHYVPSMIQLNMKPIDTVSLPSNQ